MRQEHNTEIERLMEQIISNRSEDMASVFTGLFDMAMRIEREQFLGAGHYERANRSSWLCQRLQDEKARYPGGHRHIERSTYPRQRHLIAPGGGAL